MRIWFIVILFLTLGYIFSPYINQLIEYVNYGFAKMSNMFGYIQQIFSTCLNSLSQFNYIMLIIAIFVAFKVIFYIIDVIRGEL